MPGDGYGGDAAGGEGKGRGRCSGGEVSAGVWCERERYGDGAGVADALLGPARGREFEGWVGIGGA